MFYFKEINVILKKGGVNGRLRIRNLRGTAGFGLSCNLFLFESHTNLIQISFFLTLLKKTQKTKKVLVEILGFS